jgi:tetratricopeptide (TPR) repeat protein
MSRHFNTAFNAYQAGKFNEASTALQLALLENARDARSLHLLGIIEAKQGRYQSALSFLERAVEAKPQHIPYLMDTANVVASLGNPAEAIRVYDSVLEKDQKIVEAWSNKGQALRLLGRNEEAVDCFNAALRINSKFVDSHRALAQTYWALGKSPEAVRHFDEVVKLNPVDVVSLFHRGVCLHNQQSYEKAVTDFREVTRRLPEFGDGYGRLAGALLEIAEFKDALEAATRAISLQPEQGDWYWYRGRALSELERPAEALLDFEKMYAIKKDEGNFLACAGSAYLDLNQIDRALDLYDRGLRRDPSNPIWHYNRGCALARYRRYPEAISCYEEALALDPNHATSHWNQSLALLCQGDVRGWDKYEWRWKLPANVGPDPKSQPAGIPKWHGHEDISGKRILLTAEQGLGDCIMAARFASCVKQLGATVELAVPKGLRRLFASLANVDAVLDRGESIALGRFDYYCPLLSLPRILGVSFESIPYGDSAYLGADAELVERWRQIFLERAPLSSYQTKRIGLMWRGKANRSLGIRSVRLSDLSTITELPFQFISLQKDIEKEDASLLEQLGVHHFGEDQTDFADAAAMIELMDVVVTIDTSIAHLAGALGKETWILLQYDAEWRWLTDRTDSPWYPKAKLFRQPAPGDWSSVVKEIAGRLAS